MAQQHQPSPQPSMSALEQAARLRAAAASHNQRTGGATSAPPQEEFSYLETPIDDNTQDFDDAPPHVQQAILDSRAAASTPVPQSTTPLQPDAHQQHTAPQQQQIQGYPAQVQQQAQSHPEQLHQHQAYTESRPQQYVYPQTPASQTDHSQHHIPYQSPPPERQHPAFSVPSPPTQPLPSQPPLPQTPASPGPVPMKSEGDFQQPSPARPDHDLYQNNPKLYPYTPFQAKGPLANGNGVAPFSPDNLHNSNPTLDLSTHQPGQQAHPNMKSGSSGRASSWTHSMCSCGPDVGTCFTGIFCPCILYGRTNYRLAQKSRKADPTDMLGHSNCSGHCIMFSLACGFQGVLAAILSARTRHAYKIEGEGGAGDFCKACCCCCCALVQTEREVAVREKEKARFAGPSVSAAAYKPRETMNYQPMH